MWVGLFNIGITSENIYKKIFFFIYRIQDQILDQGIFGI